ncbi:hypothetical protein ACFLRW_03385 [Acidobacteriota bacterium]
MKATKITLSLLFGLVLLFPACSGGGGENADVVQKAEENVTETPEKKELSPAEIGDHIGELYLNAMQDIIEILKDKPDAPSIKSRVEELKETHVQKFVELGKLREDLNDTDKGMLDSTLRQKIYAVSKEPWFDTFNEIQMHYFSNREFHKIVISFNIISQYADFELLKKQEPEEAKRLGIE